MLTYNAASRMKNPNEKISNHAGSHTNQPMLLTTDKHDITIHTAIHSSLLHREMIQVITSYLRKWIQGLCRASDSSAALVNTQDAIGSRTKVG